VFLLRVKRSALSLERLLCKKTGFVDIGTDADLMIFTISEKERWIMLHIICFNMSSWIQSA
jgi:hypothetical protein